MFYEIGYALFKTLNFKFTLKKTLLPRQITPKRKTQEPKRLKENQIIVDREIETE